MPDDKIQPALGLDDDAAFEESLISDSVADLTEDKTDIVSPAKPAPAPISPEKTPPLKTPSWVGKKLGHFKLLRLLGEGKMGRVIQAQDVHLNRLVALKILRKRIAGLDEQTRVQQFLREARAAAQIEHPNVVQVYEINQHDGWWYIAMEMIPGENLKKVIEVAGALPPARACPLIADAAQALAVAHEVGIIHRDIKPSNLLITRNGRCKLTDFGLVRLDDPNDPFDFTNQSVGTPHFMAPEMINRQTQTTAIDIYSLGATLFYALTGRAPYTARRLSEVIKQHLEAPPPDLRDTLPDCSPGLADLIRRTLAKNPVDRPSAADLATALRAETISLYPETSPPLTLSGSTIASQPDALTPRALREKIGLRPSPWQWLTASPRRWFPALAFALLIVFIALFIFPGQLARRLRHAPDLSEFYPDAPSTYGVLPPQSLPEAVPPDKNIPPFSWVGRVDTAGLRFVASKYGRYYYPVDHPDAVLIRRDHFIGYPSAEQARADGKSPAPNSPSTP